MRQMVSVITLGVADLQRARAFYEALGWQVSNASEIVTFSTPTVIVSLFSRSSLAEDAGVTDAGRSHGGLALAYCVPSRQEVDDVMAEAEAAGGTITRPARKTFWGGYSGYFADPDGHLWEAAYHDEWKFDEAGRVLSL